MSWMDTVYRKRWRSMMKPREVEDLSRFIIGEHNLNHIRFMDNSGRKETGRHLKQNSERKAWRMDYQL